MEIERTKSTSISCNGKQSIFDHPKVYLEIDPKQGNIDCPYCGKRFELDQNNDK